MLKIIPNVVACRQIDAGLLGWLEGKRAQTRANFPANRDYVDLRGLTLADLDQILEEEQAGFALLEARDFERAAIEEVDLRQRHSTCVPMLDFGMGSTVVPISALGCVPVMSCRGRSLGDHAHQFLAPMVTFYP